MVLVPLEAYGDWIVMPKGTAPWINSIDTVHDG
jgi:hypothetical protein